MLNASIKLIHTQSQADGSHPPSMGRRHSARGHFKRLHVRLALLR